MSSSFRRAPVLLISAVAALSACSRSNSQPKVPLNATTTSGGETAVRDRMPAVERDAIDLGNKEFRAGRYAEALTAYRQAVASAPNDPAPYFGIYMTAKKTGDSKLADSASTAIAARNGAGLMLSDSSMKELHATKAPAHPK